VNTSSKKVKQRVYSAMKEFLVVTIYLWVVLGLFAIYRSVIRAEDHVSLADKSFALINALVLAKVMVIAKEFHFGEGFDDSPLIYPTLAKSASFSLLLACFKIIEESAIGLYHGKTFQQSMAVLGGGTWQGLVYLTLLLFVMLIPFFGFTELQKLLGEGKLVKLFFRSRDVLQRNIASELSSKVERNAS
jgi:hypothetical protein